VSIGIPTYNRARQLDLAIASVLGQTHAELEIVVSDNGSADATPDACARAAASDSRVRTIRHASNVGPIRNFNSLLAELRGEYVMLLADDDALEPTFVERCLDSFAQRPDFAVVHGRTRYVSESFEAFGRDFDVTEPEPGRRVCRYLSQVYDNGAFYGLLRADAMRAALPIPNSLGGDWVWGARLVFQGGLCVRDDTMLTRSYGGASTSFEHIAEVSGLSPREATHPIARIIVGVYRDIASGSAVYAALGGRGRRLLAARAAAGLLRANCGELAWDELQPLLARPVISRAFAPLRDSYRRVRPYRPREMTKGGREPGQRTGL